MILILISGFVCIYTQKSPLTKPSKAVFNNMAHSIFGWLVIAIVKLPLYAGPLRGKNIPEMVIFGCLFLDLISHCFYFYLKFFGKKIDAEHLPQQKKSVWLREIRGPKDLRIYVGNYFIFADHVYPLDSVLASHPGGFQIAQVARGQEADKYLYGVEPVE